MNSWIRALRSSLIVLGICMRGEVIRNFLLTISLPLILTSIYVVGASAITSEVSFIIGNTYRNHVDYACVLGGASYQILWEAKPIPIYFVRNVTDFLNLYGCRITYVGRGVGALISIDLWRNSNINITMIPISKELHNVSIAGVIDCRYLRGEFIVLSSSESRETRLCPRPSTLSEVVTSFGESFSRIMSLLALLSLVPFAVISPIAFSRAIDSISREICVVRAQGMGLGELRHSLIISITILVLISSIYGISAGIVLAHGALWALRFFRVSIFSRPLPISTLLLFTGIYDILILLSAILVIYSRVGRSEDIC